MLGWSPPKILKVGQEIEKPMSCKQCHQSVEILVALLFSGMQKRPSETNQYCISDKMQLLLETCAYRDTNTPNNAQINVPIPLLNRHEMW